MPRHTTKKYRRVRIKNPKYFDKKSLRTIKVKGRPDVKMIVGCKKGKFKRGRCSIGTELQAMLYKR